jgi:hypothetical protein
MRRITDSSQNPAVIRNIDDEAVAILRSARFCAQAALTRRAALDRKGKRDVPLVVLAGENHEFVAHTLHHILFTEMVKRRESVGVCIEQPHNLLEQKYRDICGIKPDELTSAWLKANDHTGVLSIKTMLGFLGYEESNHSKATWLHFFLKHQIPARFNDAARNIFGSDLDMDDPAVQKITGQNTGRIDAKLAKGMYVRNRHMSQSIVPFFKDCGARIIIQQCGNAHVSGLARGCFIWEESIARILKHKDAANLPVLAMPAFHCGFGPKDIPERHTLEDNEWSYVRNLPETRAKYGAVEGIGFKDFDSPLGPVQLRSHQDEADWVNIRMEELGRLDECLSVDELRKQKDVLKAEMTGIFRQGPV